VVFDNEESVIHQWKQVELSLDNASFVAGNLGSGFLFSPVSSKFRLCCLIALLQLLLCKHKQHSRAP